jgi:hypothetical protein
MELESCPCGELLPVHLLQFVDDRFRHVCSCERAYIVREEKFVQDGSEVNPFARIRKAE